MDDVEYFPPVAPVAPDFESMTDRELLLFSARAAHNAETIANSLVKQFGSVMEDISHNPMFKMLLGKKK